MKQIVWLIAIAIMVKVNLFAFECTDRGGLKIDGLKVEEIYIQSK